MTGYCTLRSPNPGEQEKQARSSHCLESLQTVKWDQNVVNILAAELFHFADVFFRCCVQRK